ncbi:hypothetical protein [Paenibacillus sp. P22]|uniref:hypothetical protein n=1 Tax=Paenibacillus sp. P22 TaxID=483908 RepID=UPI000430E568|nr:hypothetical protein [Paenibacillus sp. P22]CDN44189.1 hypothetical protein BN871_EI_00180 [Paenibacillus sp. P22]
MAIVESSGTASCSSSSSAAAVLILPMAGSIFGNADCSAAAVLIRKSFGTSYGVATASAQPVRIQSTSGNSTGRSVLPDAVAARYIIMGGQADGQATAEAFATSRDISQALKDFLPGFLQQSSLFSAAQKLQVAEIIRLLAVIEEFRRDLLPGKNRRPESMTTPAFKAMVNNFYRSKVNVYPDEYRLKTTIYSKRGIPENIAEMEGVVEQRLSAHLLHEFNFTYLPFDEMEEVKLTLEQMQGMGSFDQIERTFLIPVEEVLNRNGV